MMAKLSSLSTNPLFSSIITLYTLIFLYFPSHFHALVFSPVLISTFILLLSLLRLGAIQEDKEKQNKEIENEEESYSEKILTEELNSTAGVSNELNSTPLQQIPEVFDNDREWVSSQVDEGGKGGLGSNLGPGPNPSPFYADSFLEWDVRAPLEVIYEAYEGEEGQNGDDLEENRETQMAIFERYASLSMYYPETDTDTSSSEGDFPLIGDSESPENVGFRWEEEDGEGLIEIALDGKRRSEAEEENLIEIDLRRRGSRRDDMSFRRDDGGSPMRFRRN